MLRLPAGLLAVAVSHIFTAKTTTAAATAPPPLAINPDQNWDGIDGAWSTFTLRVGTPAQTVRTYVSFNSYQTWVILPKGCLAAQDQAACADDRGALFNQSASSSFNTIGIYDVSIEKWLGLDTNAIFGYDTVGLGGLGEGGPTLKNTTVGAMAALDFYVGVLGVNPKPTNFTSFDDPSPSYMTMLYQQNYIPSVSFGYTAGAKYRFTGVLASLTLGGYDTSKFIQNDVNFIFAPDSDRNLMVAIQSITTPSRIESSPVATELLPSPVYALIDSTIAQMWLPIEACQAFEIEFGLIYDYDTSLYLVNDTLHQELLSRDANITFQLAQGLNGGPSVQIALPYAAFDLEAQPPFQGLSNTTRYFPLRRAQNDTQYTLGRAFLQEAYISVDWESANFNVSQASWPESSQPHLVPIIPNSSNAEPSSVTGGSYSTTKEKSGQLSGGVIAGMSVGAVAALVILGIIVMFYFRRKTSSKKADDEKSDSNSATAVDSSRQSNRSVYRKAELEGSSVPETEHRRLLSTNASAAPTVPGTPNSAISPYSPGYVMSVNGGSVSVTPSGGEGTHSSMQSGPLFSSLSAIPGTPSEADSKERQIFEMPGDMPSIKEKDGKALSEKEAMAHRERVYNGVESAPSSATDASDSVREPRRIDPQNVVRTNLSVEPLEPALRRQFSFEHESHRELYE